MRRGRWVVHVALVVVAAGSGAAYALARPDPPASKSSSDPVSHIHTSVRVSPTRYFSVLRREHVTPVSAEQAKELQRATGDPSTIKQLYAPNARAAVPLSVKTLDSSRHAYAIPGTGALCLYVPDSTGFGSISCEATQIAVHGYVLDVQYRSLSSDNPTVTGLARNGVTTAVGTTADGRSVSVPIVDNAYELELNHLRQIKLGSDTLTIPAPLG